MATIRDVAELANVSVATVSRCLNNSGYVSEASRKKVIQASEMLNYSPMLSAQVMRTNKSKLIALIILTLKNSYFVELAAHIDNECLKRGYRLILCNIDENIDKEKSYLEMIRNMSLDGVIIAGGERVYDEIKDKPVIILDRVNKNNMTKSSVTSDNYNGAVLATEHLIEIGCKKLLYIHPQENNYASELRKQAYLDICSNHGISANVIGFLKRSDIRSIDLTKYDGVFAWNDEVGVDIIFNAIKNGISIPDDLAVIGFDNNLLSRRIVPTLSTIEQPYEIMAEKAVDMLIKLINNPDENKEHVEISTKLIKRESTGGMDE